VLVGNKCDMDEGKRAVPYSKGQALADEFGIQFFETSAKSNVNVDEARRPNHPGCRRAARTATPRRQLLTATLRSSA